MKEYLTSAGLKCAARVHMFGNYGITVRAYIWMNAILLILTWLFASMNNSGAGSLVSTYIFLTLRLLISGIFAAGVSYLYLHIASGRQAYPSMIFHGFREHTDKAVLICLVINALELICCIPMLVFYTIYTRTNDTVYLIPMAVGALIAICGALYVEALSMPAYYLLHDFPDYAFKDIVLLCPKLMKGHIGRLIYMYMSFIPLMLLEVLSLGAAAPWVSSYIHASVTEMYLDIMSHG